jgi:small subunit ribosomal protein S2
MNVPIVAIVDTNGDPDEIDYPIPGNDDAVRAIELFSSKIAESIVEGKKNKISKELLQEKAEETAAASEETAEAGGEPVENAG